MAVPKRRNSKARGRLRRTHYVPIVPSLRKCRECGAPHLSHAICPVCGKYKSRMVIDYAKALRDKAEKEKEKKGGGA